MSGRGPRRSAGAVRPGTPAGCMAPYTHGGVIVEEGVGGCCGTPNRSSSIADSTVDFPASTVIPVGDIEVLSTDPRDHLAAAVWWTDRCTVFSPNRFLLVVSRCITRLIASWLSPNRSAARIA